MGFIKEVCDLRHLKQAIYRLGPGPFPHVPAPFETSVTECIGKLPKCDCDATSLVMEGKKINCTLSKYKNLTIWQKFGGEVCFVAGYHEERANFPLRTGTSIHMKFGTRTLGWEVLTGRRCSRERHCCQGLMGSAPSPAGCFDVHPRQASPGSAGVFSPVKWK